MSVKPGLRIAASRQRCPSQTARQAGAVRARIGGRLGAYAVVILAASIAFWIAVVPVAAFAADDNDQATETTAAAESSDPEEAVSSDSKAAVSDSREMLGLFGVEESHFRMFFDGRPVDQNESEALLKVLYAVRRFKLSDTEKWARDLPSIASAASAAEGEQRGEIYRLSGHVTLVEREHPLPELVDRFQMEEFYRCTVELSGERPATIYALAIPKKWPVGKPFRQRISARGFFLKHAASEPPAEPVFAAQRLAWHPPSLLGDLEMDVGLFDEIKNRTRIQSRESECFYQLLAAVSRAGTQELVRRTRAKPERKYSVVPLFNTPDTQHGKLFAFTGTARRAMLVRIDDREVIERFGFDRYYQIEVFTEDSQSNPLVFCVLKLPRGMPSGPNISETVYIPGFFFKTWAYQLQQLDDGPARNQLAPMLIGREPLWIVPEAGASMYAPIAGGLFLLAMLGVWLVVWNYNRGDKKFYDRTLSGRLVPEPPKSLNEIGLEASEPDFRGM